MKEINELYDFLSKINYGWHDKDGNRHTSLKDGHFTKNFRMQDSEHIYQNNYAICWELCELEREFFTKKNISYQTIFAVIKHHKHYYCHTFVVFKKKKYYYWFEASWQQMKGIKKYIHVNDIFEDIKNNFQDFIKSMEYDKSNIKFYLYKKPRKNIRCNAFYRHAMIFGKRIHDPNKIFKA